MQFVDFIRLRLRRMLGQSDIENEQPLAMIGHCEWCRLEELNVGWVNARIVTGNRTSTLHVSNIKPYYESGQQNVEFSVRHDEKCDDSGIVCHAAVLEQREFKGPNGSREMRWIIQSRVSLGDSNWTIPMALTSQKPVRFRMMLGRTALEGKFIVDSSKSYLMGNGRS